MIPLPADQRQAAAAAAFAALNADTGEAVDLPPRRPSLRLSLLPPAHLSRIPPVLPGGNIPPAPRQSSSRFSRSGFFGFYFGRRRALASVQGCAIFIPPRISRNLRRLVFAPAGAAAGWVGLLASPSFIEHLVIGGLPAERLAQLNPDELLRCWFPTSAKPPPTPIASMPARIPSCAQARPLGRPAPDRAAVAWAGPLLILAAMGLFCGGAAGLRRSCAPATGSNAFMVRW